MTIAIFLAYNTKHITKGFMKKINESCKDCSSLCQSIFNGMTTSSLEDSSNHKIPNLFKKGQTLFMQGNPAYGVFCVKSGIIKVSQIDSNGNESIVRLAQKGDVVGHRSLFSNQPYQSTATALEEAQVCFFDKNFITKLVETEPTTAFNIINSLGKDLGSAEKRISSFSQNNVRERLAELILFLGKGYGEKVGDKTKVNIVLKRDEMASMIGTANETLIRFMSEFKKDGLIEQEGKTIYILDEDRLLEYAGIDS